MVAAAAHAGPMAPGVPAAASAATAAGALAAQGEAQTWKGVATLPGLELDFVVTLTPDDAALGGWRGTIDIPLQGLSKGALSAIAIDETSISFDFAPPGAPASAAFRLTRDPGAGEASGHIGQAGMQFPVRMERIGAEQAADVGPRRPQTPKPPFPYKTRDVEVENVSAAIRLAGTLVIPEGPGPHPAVVFATGSGAQDRDETLMGHKPFLVIADYLARRGIASLRMDDRGVGGSGGNTMQSTTPDFASDIRAGVAFLKQQREVSPRRIGLIGHSEGGMIAAAAAVDHPDVAFVVMLAGTAVVGHEIWVEQTRRMGRTGGAGERMLDAQEEAQRKVVDAVLSNGSEDDVFAALQEMALAQRGGRPAPDQQAVDDMLRQQAKQLATPWFRGFLEHDPRPDLRRLRVPALALNGELDLQVPPDQNLPEIEKALREAGNTDVTIIEMRGLNHLFQHSATGGMQEYAAIEETFSPRALEIVAEWIRRKTGLE